MIIPSEKLHGFTAAIFAAAGCEPPEDQQIANHLVEANLVGHDSHGVIRVPPYVDYLRRGMVRANRQARVVFETDVLLVVDGEEGFGQSIGEQAMRLAIDKARGQGVAVLGLRNCGHLGRIGDWPLMAAGEGFVSLHFVNTSGFGLLVAPYGGIERRLSANPIAVGIPVEGRAPIVLDISTCAIAEGKIRVAFNKGAQVPAGAVIDAQGRPTTDPRVFYADPPGAILPFGGHKGYGLGIVTEILAGALSGSGCSRPGAVRLLNGMLAIVIDPNRMPSEAPFASEVSRYVEFVKSSRTSAPGGEILMPGEVEERTRKERLKRGIELDETTWGQLVDTARVVGLNDAAIPRDGSVS